MNIKRLTIGTALLGGLFLSSYASSNPLTVINYVNIANDVYPEGFPDDHTPTPGLRFNSVPDIMKANASIPKVGDSALLAYQASQTQGAVAFSWSNGFQGVCFPEGNPMHLLNVNLTKGGLVTIKIHFTSQGIFCRCSPSSFCS